MELTWFEKVQCSVKESLNGHSRWKLLWTVKHKGHILFCCHGITDTKQMNFPDNIGALHNAHVTQITRILFHYDGSGPCDGRTWSWTCQESSTLPSQLRESKAAYYVCWPPNIEDVILCGYRGLFSLIYGGCSYGRDIIGPEYVVWIDSHKAPPSLMSQDLWDHQLWQLAEGHKAPWQGSARNQRNEWLVPTWEGMILFIVL